MTETGHRHFARLRPFPLPGGERAIREGRRVALGLLFELRGERALEDEGWESLGFARPALKALGSLLASGTQCPRATSVGRLFDAVAALLGVRAQSSYEGQAARELEGLATRSTAHAPLPFGVEEEAGRLTLDWGPLVEALLEHRREGMPISDLARRFHLTLVEMILRMAVRLGCRTVALGGGCFQNRLLLEQAIERLRERGFDPVWSRDVPPNDGGIAVGQIAAAAMKERGRLPCA